MTFTNLFRRRVAVVAGSVLAVIALSSCAAADSGTADEGPTIALSTQSLSDAFQLALAADLDEQAAEQGATLLEPVNADFDATKQATDFQTILAREPDAIIVGPVDADAIVPSITKANQQDVPVIAVDNAPNGGDVYMTVRADNVGMGDKGCIELGKLLDGKGTVLELQGALSSSNGLERTTGFQDCMKASYPDITVVSKPTDWSLDKAAAAVQTVVSTQDIDGVFMASEYLLPVVQSSLTALGRWAPSGEEGHMILVGIDGAPDAFDLIRDGYQEVSVAQPANLYAEWAVKYAIAAVEGETFKAGPTDHDSELVETPAGFVDLLPATVVTSENVDDSALWGNAG